MDALDAFEGGKPATARQLGPRGAQASAAGGRGARAEPSGRAGERDRAIDRRRDWSERSMAGEKRARDGEPQGAREAGKRGRAASGGERRAEAAAAEVPARAAASVDQTAEAEDRAAAATTTTTTTTTTMSSSKASLEEEEEEEEENGKHAPQSGPGADGETRNARQKTWGRGEKGSADKKDDVDNDDNEDDEEEEEEEEELTIMLDFKLLQGKVSSLTDLPEINVQRGIRKDTIRASIGEFAFEGEVKPALGSIALFAKNNELKSCSFVATVDTTADLDTLSKQTPKFAMLPLRIKPPPQQQQQSAGSTDNTVGSPRNAN